MLEQTQVTIETQSVTTTDTTSLPLTPDIYSPNWMRYTLDAPSPGLVVIKDGFYPGWSATVDGEPADLLRVNGMVRGIFVEHAGHHIVELVYRPRGFVVGIWLGFIVILLFLVGVVNERLTHQTEIPLWLLASGGLVALLIIWFGLQAYFRG